MPQHFYTATLTPGVGYIATLNRGDHKALIRVGTFTLSCDADKACRKHHERAKAFLARVGKPVPEAFFI
jgi:hypothetical protein